MLAYCVKCRAKREMVSPTKVKTKNNRHAMKGKCKKCGCKMMRFIKS